MKEYKEDKISSALVAYLPEFKGFFYFGFMEFFFKQTLKFIGKKTIKQIIHLKTPYGASGLIVLPHTLRQLQDMSRDDLEKEVYQAIALAGAEGAKKISFAGQLPSCLNYCADFSHSGLNSYKKKITTGHTMTCLAVVSAFEYILKKTQLRILSVVGVGSIGYSSLILLLEKAMQKKPQKIILCDLKRRREKLQTLANEIEKTYQIQTVSVFYDDDSFGEVYQADMFLGASGSGSVLKIDKIRPGAVLIDDSFPPIISVRNSIKRMKQRQDVLILGGGKMCVSNIQFKSSVWYIPQWLVSLFLNNMGKEGLPGCWLEAVVFSAVSKEGLVTQGHITSEQLLSSWQLKTDFHLKIPPLHFYKYTIPQPLIDRVYLLRSQN